MLQRVWLDGWRTGLLVKEGRKWNTFLVIDEQGVRVKKLKATEEWGTIAHVPSLTVASFRKAGVNLGIFKGAERLLNEYESKIPTTFEEVARD